MAATPINIRNGQAKVMKVRVEPGGMEVRLGQGETLRLAYEPPLFGEEVDICPDGRDGVTVRLPTTEFSVRQGVKPKAA